MEMGTAAKVKNILLILLFTCTVGSSAGAYYFYGQYSELKNNPDAVAQGEVTQMVKKVGRLIELPADETPTVATVSEPEKLKDQSFFANAKKGDKLIVYSGAKKAILYDPVADKIIEVGPVNITGQNDGATGEENKADATTNDEQESDETINE